MSKLLSGRFSVRSKGSGEAVYTFARARLIHRYLTTRDVFYVRREVDLMKTAKVNAYIMHIFGKIEL